ncbi:hypothetical protein HanIR_Chr14g0724641 [Helianthus annuus]|nr:hypothetical protein HanIR_Chr14g0724641 [Helianthus annuus]
MNAKYCPSKSPFSSVNPANFAIEYKVPVVSKTSTYRNVINASQKAGLLMPEKLNAPAVDRIL